MKHFSPLARLSCAATIALTILATPAGAAEVVDQAQTVATAEFGVSASKNFDDGQSFTAGANQISFATFDLRSSAPTDFEVEIYSGLGMDGTLLGTSDATTVAAGTNFAGLQVTKFNFSTPVSLTTGSTYSLFVVPASTATADLWEGFAQSDLYAGGELFFQSSDSFVDYWNNDMYFSEGYDKPATATVPEPANAALLLAGLALVGAVVRRRKA